MLKLDPVLFEQALFNILTMRRKYSPAASTISIRAEQVSGGVQLKSSMRERASLSRTSKDF